MAAARSSSIASDPGHFNPAITTGFTQHVVADSIFNGLVGLDENLQPVPDLADRWDISDDGTTYTFTTRACGTTARRSPRPTSSSPSSRCS